MPDLLYLSGHGMSLPAEREQDARTNRAGEDTHFPLGANAIHVGRLQKMATFAAVADRLAGQVIAEAEHNVWLA